MLRSYIMSDRDIFTREAIVVIWQCQEPEVFTDLLNEHSNSTTLAFFFCVASRVDLEVQVGRSPGSLEKIHPGVAPSVSWTVTQKCSMNPVSVSRSGW